MGLMLTGHMTRHTMHICILIDLREVFCIYNGKRSQGTDPKLVKIDLMAWDYQRVCYLLPVFCNEKRDTVKGF